jgi:uroporphyrinogen decarboxylase-like protein
MSRTRYLQALHCQAPSVIPHQISLPHPEFISNATGVDYHEQPMTASVRFHQRFDVDNGGPTHVDDTPLPRPTAGQSDDGGRQTDEAFHTVWHDEAPFTDPEQLWAFDPDPWGKDADKAMQPGYALKNFRWAFEPDTWPQRRAEEQAAWARLEARFPGKFTPGPGFYCTTFMWGICIFGWDLFLTALGLDPDKTGQALGRIAEVTVNAYAYFASNEDNVFVGPHDDLCMTSGPVTSPEWYREYIWPQYETIFAPFKAAGKPVILTSDGDISKLAPDLAAIVDGFVFESSTPADFMFERFGRDKVLIGGIDVRPMTFGTPDNVEQEVTRAVQRGRDCPGFVISCSDTIPGNVPVANVHRYFEVVERLRHRC